MKISIIIVIFFLLLSSCEDNTSNVENENQNFDVIKTVKLKSQQDTIDYSLGIIIGKQMKNYGIRQINEEMLMKAIKDVLTENEQNLPIHPDVAKQIVSLYVQQTVVQKDVSEMDENEQFFKNNLLNSDVVQLPSGVQYKEILKGSGKIPSEYDNVTVDYSGQLLNGDVFVSTEGKIPVSFEVKASLKGWQEVLTRMPEGAEWLAYLPPEFAFGKNGGKNVPPNSVVIYKIKLLKIN